jgi:hypothetical protein
MPKKPLAGSTELVTEVMVTVSLYGVRDPTLGGKGVNEAKTLYPNRQEFSPPLSWFSP